MSENAKLVVRRAEKKAFQASTLTPVGVAAVGGVGGAIAAIPGGAAAVATAASLAAAAGYGAGQLLAAPVQVVTEGTVKWLGNYDEMICKGCRCCKIMATTKDPSEAGYGLCPDCFRNFEQQEQERQQRYEREQLRKQHHHEQQLPQPAGQPVQSHMVLQHASPVGPYVPPGHASMLPPPAPVPPAGVMPSVPSVTPGQPPLSLCMPPLQAAMLPGCPSPLGTQQVARQVAVPASWPVAMQQSASTLGLAAVPVVPIAKGELMGTSALKLPLEQPQAPPPPVQSGSFVPPASVSLTTGSAVQPANVAMLGVPLQARPLLAMPAVPGAPGELQGVSSLKLPVDRPTLAPTVVQASSAAAPAGGANMQAKTLAALPATARLTVAKSPLGIPRPTVAEQTPSFVPAVAAPVPAVRLAHGEALAAAPAARPIAGNYC